MIKTEVKYPFLEMEEEQKDKYIEVLRKICLDEFIKYCKSNSNKKYFEEILIPSKRKLYLETYKKDKLLEGFNRTLLENLDDKKFEKWNNKMIKKIIDDNNLSDSIINNNNFDEKKMAEFLSEKGNKKDLIIDFLKCIGCVVNISEEIYANAETNIELNNLKEQLKTKDEKISNLEADKKNTKQEIGLLKEQIKTKDKEISTLKEVQKQKDQEILLLKEDSENQITSKDKIISDLKQEIEKNNEQINKANINASINLNETNTKVTSDNIESISEQDNNMKIKITVDRAIYDLEGRTLLGVVKAEGIQIEKSWIIITPIVPIINDNSNINREDFINRVDYRSDYSTFMLFINKNVLRMCLSEEDAENYYYYSNDQKFSCLFEAFCGKILFFTPIFKDNSINEKFKLNAFLLAKPIKYMDFNNSKFIPRYNSTKPSFEAKLNRHEDLVLYNYPASLSSNLKYVFVKDTIYEINYIPVVDDEENGYTTWKYNGQEGKPAFKKLDIKITNSENDKYIFTPSIYVDKQDDLYVKNITLIQANATNNTIFDEENFINNVSDIAKSKNLYYEESDLKNFHIALKSSNLVILAGPSGLGKTKLPLIYANTLGLDSARGTVLFVPISPSYLEPEDVLGYVKPGMGNQEMAEYIESNTGLVSFLIDAAEHKDRMHLVIFDEMNLSQIEHWFAPFISLLEQEADSRVLSLYSRNLILKNSDKYPCSITIGENISFIGTVNLDETTKQISDRLLDRAVVINLSSPSFEKLRNINKINTDISPEVSYSRFATSVAKIENAAQEFKDEELSLINEINTLLTNSTYSKGISFRTLTKMALYLKNSGNIFSRDLAFDFIVLQFIIKRINGSREELESILSDDDTIGILNILNNFASISPFVRTRKLLKQKFEEINKYGFTK